MSFDYKKEYKEFYMPKNKPQIVDIPEMKFIAVRGKGDPNNEDGEYKVSIGLLYGIAFTIKMSKKGSHKVDGYFDYMVPPLEGFWWQENTVGLDYSRKEDFLEPYDDEPITVALMDQFLEQNGYENDLSAERMHHKIYLSDARRVVPEKLRTVIRHPIKKVVE